MSSVSRDTRPPAGKVDFSLTTPGARNSRKAERRAEAPGEEAPPSLLSVISLAPVSPRRAFLSSVSPLFRNGLLTV